MDSNHFIQKVAQKITGLGLAGPAILLLEANKPLAFLGSQFLLIAQPTLDIFLPQTLTQQTHNLLADPAQLEQLIVCLETKPSGSDMPPSGPPYISEQPLTEEAQ